MKGFTKLKNLCLEFLTAGLDFLGGPLLLFFLRSRGIRTYAASQFFQYPVEVLKQTLLISICFFLIFGAFLLALRKNFLKSMGLEISGSFQIGCVSVLILLLVMAAAFAVRRTEDPRQIFWNLCYYVFIIGLPEEFVFRGACPWLLRSFPWQVRYLLPNFLFAMIHVVAFGRFEPLTSEIFSEFLLTQMPGLMASGCCLQLMKERTGTLWTSILLHGLMDFSILFL